MWRLKGNLLQNGFLEYLKLLHLYRDLTFERGPWETASLIRRNIIPRTNKKHWRFLGGYNNIKQSQEYFCNLRWIVCEHYSFCRMIWLQICGRSKERENGKGSLSCKKEEKRLLLVESWKFINFQDLLIAGSDLIKINWEESRRKEWHLWVNSASTHETMSMQTLIWNHSRDFPFLFRPNQKGIKFVFIFKFEWKSCLGNFYQSLKVGHAFKL